MAVKRQERRTILPRPCPAAQADFSFPGKVKKRIRALDLKGQKKDELIAQDPRSAEIIRPDYLCGAVPPWPQPLHDYGNPESLHEQGMQGLDNQG